MTRSKLVIHEVDEPPLGVPGELHFDDEEEEVERGGLTSIHLKAVSILECWQKLIFHQKSFRSWISTSARHLLFLLWHP